MRHEQHCIDATREHKYHTYNYVMDWPNHCRHCGGWGEFIYTYDPSPSGVSLGSGFMIDADPCSECSSEGICPRCGQHTWSGDDDMEMCHLCGFKFGESEGIYDVPECWCEFEQDIGFFGDVPF